MDTRKLIYNRIAEAILAYDRECYVAQTREITNRKVPCAFITQISKARVRRYSTLANTDEQNRLGFEAEVYAKKIGAAYALMEVIEDEFKSIGFLQNACEPLESGDPTIFRLVARFYGYATSTLPDKEKKL